MPLHFTGLISRYQLDHPDEHPPEQAVPLNYERVLKFNPNHGPDGRFTSGGGGRRGGTEGPPTSDALGRPFRKGGAGTRLTGIPEKYREQARNVLEGYGRLFPQTSGGVHTPSKGGAPSEYSGGGVHTPPSKGTPEYASGQPHVPPGSPRSGQFHAESGAGKKPFTFTDEQKSRNFKEMFGTAKTLEYRPDRDAGQGQSKTLEFRPDRDKGGEVQNVRNVAATPQVRLKELDEMTAGYEKQLKEKGIGKRAASQIQASLGMIQRERTGLQRQLHPDTPARIKVLNEMEAGYAKQLGERGLGKRVARQIRGSLGMIRRERTGLTYRPR